VPQWLIWVVLVIVAIAIIWFFWNRSQESKAAAERAEVERRRADSSAARAAAAAPRAAAPRAAAPVEPRIERVESRLQDAADTALGTELPEETARIEAAAAELARARREADAAADRLSAQAEATLAEVRQAGEQLNNPDEPIDVETVLIEERRNSAGLAAQESQGAGGDQVPPGAVRGDGGRDCPPVYPIKANTHSMLYHTTASHSYSHTIPGLCFTTTSAAEAAGFSPAQDG
jgi:type IV secretory pathway VirB10-like protein